MMDVATQLFFKDKICKKNPRSNLLQMTCMAIITRLLYSKESKFFSENWDRKSIYTRISPVRSPASSVKHAKITFQL